MLNTDRGLRQTGYQNTRWVLPIASVALLASGLMLGGCPNPKVGFDSPAPNKRVDAIVLAADQDDHESLVMLIEKLESTDSVERMMAIRSLEKREGETLGYEHAAPAPERMEAIERWREYAGLSDDHADHDDSPMTSETGSEKEDSESSNEDG
ncbi:MAG: hypothetical protein ACSHX5_11280 [Phycisphaerales bacterium]